MAVNRLIKDLFSFIKFKALVYTKKANALIMEKKSLKTFFENIETDKAFQELEMAFELSNEIETVMF